MIFNNIKYNNKIIQNKNFYIKFFLFEIYFLNVK